MNKTLTTLLGVIAVLTAAIFMLAGGSSDAADIAFIGRGVVKPGGGSNNINVYWTHVPSSVEKIRGIRSDVNTADANLYAWDINSSGNLVKYTTSSLPTPEKEVVIRGSLHSDDRVTASWVVNNYREYKLTGTLQGVDRDTGKADSGWITVNVDTSQFRDVTPAKDFKGTKVDGNDVRVRVNGMTNITALGKTKHLDEVTANQQDVIIEGEVLNEDTWVASKFWETN